VFFATFGFGMERKTATPDVYAGVAIPDVDRFICPFLRARAIKRVDF
jgi:hypothetical protein